MADLENVEMNTEEDFLGEMNAETPLVATGEANSWWSWLRKPQEPKFTKIADVEYPSRSGIQTEKHKIDIYIPKSNGANDAKAHKRPVLVHVHGGGWVRGDKSHWFYGSPAMGSAFASFNFVVVTVGYRTKVPFPGAIEDVSDAIAWVYEHIEEKEFGNGDRERVFLSGHSAGGHLASLAALDKRWLRGVPQNFIKGVLSISGIYNVSDPLDSVVASWGYKKLYSTPTFGTDVDFMLDCSPLTHLNNLDTNMPHHTPPFFLLNAAKDFGLEKDGRSFHAAFNAKGLSCRYQVLQKESHGSISRSEQTMLAARDFFVSLMASLTELAPSETQPL